VTVSIDFESAPPGHSTRRLLVSSDDSDESPYPGGVFINVENAEACYTLTRTLTGQGSDGKGASPTCPLRTLRRWGGFSCPPPDRTKRRQARVSQSFGSE
jgi:hypothetical protein